MKYIPLLAMLLLGACEYSGNKIDMGIPVSGYSTVIIDSCEYVQYHIDGTSHAICHKGNCRFCAARKQPTQ